MMGVLNRAIAIVAILALVLSIGMTAYASDWGDGLTQEIEENSQGQDDSQVSKDVGGLLTNMAVIIKVVAVATAVVILIVLAMKYMIASPGDKADVKKSMIPFVIGAFIIFGATGIISMLISFSSQIKGE